MNVHTHAIAAYCIGGWVGPRAGLDVMGSIKILPRQESNPDRAARNYTD
jgi:hypothetical protein